MALAAYYRAALLGTTRGPAVAVLPFANETGDSEDAQISEGLGDALRARLTELPSVSVQARASSVSFRGQNADARTIARSLGVGVLINGTLRRQGKTLDVLVEIVDDKGFAIRQPLSFQGADRDLLKLQQQIAAEVGALLVPAARASLAPAAPPPTSQSESANRLVIFGSHYDHEVRDDITVDKQEARQGDQLLRTCNGGGSQIDWGAYPFGLGAAIQGPRRGGPRSAVDRTEAR